MFKEVQLYEIEENGFLHSYINECSYEVGKKFIIKLSHADLKNDDALFYNCTITITDWLDFEVIEYHGNEIFNKFGDNNIPELDSIVNFTYENKVLILEDLCGIDAIYNFRFTNPKIHITGEYEPD